MSPLGSRSFAAGHFLFNVDAPGGQGAAYVRSVSGGMVKGTVLQDQAGPDATQFKHLGAVEIEQIDVELGMALSRPVLEWIQSSWQRKFSRRNGSIIHADFNLKCQQEQWFEGALITSTKFPTCDGSTNEPGYLGVTLHPETVRTIKGDGRDVTGTHALHQKLWQPCNFRLDILGIDCSHVSKIDSFSVTQKLKPLYTGPMRFPEMEPVGIDFGGLVIYVASEHGGDFVKWYEKFIMRGGKETNNERDGTLEFLAPDMKTVLLTINLNRLGIHKLSLEKSEANAQQIKRLKIETYLESMELAFVGQYMK